MSYTYTNLLTHMIFGIRGRIAHNERYIWS